MKGNILDAMCRGIDSSDVVLVFLTSNYMAKVASGNDGDNVRREFMYASNTPKKFLCIKFEDLPNPWTGPVSMILGSQLYVDFTDATGNDSIDVLVDAIRRRSPKVMWKTAVQRTRRIPHNAPQLTTHSTPLRVRVQRICNASGTPAHDMHLCKLVDRLHESLVGTVDPNVPLIQRVQIMERNLGISP